MLTLTKHGAKQGLKATHLPGGEKLADLEFASTNQQLEGFPGKITDAVPLLKIIVLENLAIDMANRLRGANKWIAALASHRALD